MPFKLIRFLGRWLTGRSSPPQIPDELWQSTLQRIAFLSALDADERQRLREITRQFLAEKQFSGAGGLQLTDSLCVDIAAQACLPILNLGLAAYRGWVGIVVYPGEFIVPRSEMDEFGVVHEYDDSASGEAWEGGPVLVSWDDVKMAGQGYNVVIHEFAHKLDMQNGEVDGVPALHSGIGRSEWEQVLQASYDDFCSHTEWLESFETMEDDAADFEVIEETDENDGSTYDENEFEAFDPYASTDLAEFFAVMSETFFEMPGLLNNHYPRLYEMFCRFYRQDPLKRLPLPIAVAG